MPVGRRLAVPTCAPGPSTALGEGGVNVSADRPVPDRDPICSMGRRTTTNWVWLRSGSGGAPIGYLRPSVAAFFVGFQWTPAVLRRRLGVRSHCEAVGLVALIDRPSGAP
jgi:hypothetical protein